MVDQISEKTLIFTGSVNRSETRFKMGCNDLFKMPMKNEKNFSGMHEAKFVIPHSSALTNGINNNTNSDEKCFNFMIIWKI